MIIAEFSVIPLGTADASVSDYVRVAVDVLKQQNVKLKPGAMGTVIEAENLEELFKAVELAHEAVFRAGAKRVVTEIKIDDRRDKEASVEGKLGALK